MSLKAKVKLEILKYLIHKCDRAYDRTYQYAKKYLFYDNLISALEAKECKQDINDLQKEANVKIDTFTYSWKGGWDVQELLQKALKSDYVILCEKETFLHVNAKEEIVRCLSKNPQAIVLYGDEDVVDKDGIRTNPWLKPAWSPTLFLKQHYIGALAVVKGDTLAKVLRDVVNITDIRLLIYEACKAAGGFGLRNDKIVHLDKVLVHQPDVSSYEKYMNCQRLEAVSGGALGSAQANASDEKVSIVIPSKDQPDVLMQNLKSLEKTVQMAGVEVIVVDNGSTPENKNRIRRLIQDLTFEAIYIYKPMEFNFSAMCNIGAQESHGEYLLFLNDDIEAIDGGWLEAMVNAAAREYAGCVGAKLLYPGTNKIQHAGVMNLSQGPIHKLQYQTDDTEHYFGWNKTDRECLAVTGACLMIKRKLFDEVGGFDEDLSVTFNDIDLCYKLYAKGYYNICLNSISLYHHESLSRGMDESEEKRVRLVKERETLYGKHPALRDEDPFYHGWLNRQMGDMRIAPALEECLDLQQAECVVKPWSQNTWKDLRRHEGVRMSLEEGKQKGYLLMLGDDNACYEKRIILTNIATMAQFWCSLNDTLREDVELGMPDQVNVALSGFEVKIVGLPAGEYEVKAVAHNKISGVSYWKETAYKLSLTEE